MGAHLAFRISSRLLVSAAVLQLSALLARGQAVDRFTSSFNFLLNGITGSEYPRNAYASTYAIWAEHGFPVALGQSDPPSPTVAAVDLVSNGSRLVAFGHEGIISSCCSNGDAWDKLVINSFGWLADTRTDRTKVRIGAMRGVTSESRLAAVLQGLQAAVASSSQPPTITAVFVDLDAFTAGAWVNYDVMWIDTYAEYTPSQVQGLIGFARRPGKGLIVGGHAWNWGSTHPNPNIFIDLAVNRILWPLGLVVTTNWVYGFKPAPSSAPLDWPYYSAYKVLKAVLAEKNGQLTFNPSMVPVAKRSLLALMNLLPPRSMAAASGLNGVWSLLDQLRGVSPPVVGPTTRFPAANATFSKWLQVYMEVTAIRSGDITDLKASPSAASYPGSVPANAYIMNVDVVINGTYKAKSYNLPYAGYGSAVWRSTGLYAQPGKVVTVSVRTPAAINKGLEVQIGAHTDDLTNKASWSRLPYIVNRFSLRNTTTRVGNPMGGLIFVLVPRGSALGNVSISFRGVVRYPWFRMGLHDLTKWKTIRNNPGPWAELDGGKFVIMLPSKAIRKLEDPISLLKHWNKVLDSMAYLANFTANRPRAERFLVDADISAGWMHSGYPIMAYDQPSVWNEMLNLTMLKAKGAWGPFHELGHNHQWGDMMFSGTTESHVNLFTIYALESTGVPKTAWENWRNVDPKNRAAARAAYLAKGAPWSTEWNVWIALDTYLQLKEGFGWEFYRRIYTAYRTMTYPLPENNVQIWIQTTCQVAGVNLVPFYTKWGFPISATSASKCQLLPRWAQDPMNPTTVG